MLNGRYSLPEGRPPALRALIKDCLTVSPRQRPTIQQVVARLEALGPADGESAVAGGVSVQPPQLAAVAEAGPAAAGAAAGGLAGSGERQPLHERVPSHGWADFSSDSPAGAGSPGSASHSRRHSGSLASWATFSPKRAAEAVAGAAGAVAASAGSFWSSFGEAVPSEPPEPLVAPGEQAQVQALSSEVEALSSRQATLPPAQRHAQQQQQPPPPQQQQQPQQAQQRQQPAAEPRAAPPQPADVSPLSAGLARMNLGGPTAAPAPPPQSALHAARLVPHPQLWRTCPSWVQSGCTFCHFQSLVCCFLLQGQSLPRRARRRWRPRRQRPLPPGRAASGARWAAMPRCCGSTAVCWSS